MKFQVKMMKHFFLFLVVVLQAHLITAFANTRTNKVSSINKKFAELETINGKIGIYAINTETGQSISYRATERFPIQSTSKVMVVSAILNESVLRQSLLKQKITYAQDDLVVWSPVTEKHVSVGMTISELCRAAIEYSDNTATNLLMKKLGGPLVVTSFSRMIGDDTFRLDNWEPNLNSDMTDLRDTSTPKAMAKSLQILTNDKGLPYMQQKQLLAWMKDNTTGNTRIRAGVPRGWIVADKTGSDNNHGIANDIGIIWPTHCAPIILALYAIHDKKGATQRDEMLAASTRIIIDEFAKTDFCLKRAILL